MITKLKPFTITTRTEKGKIVKQSEILAKNKQEAILIARGMKSEEGFNEFEPLSSEARRAFAKEKFAPERFGLKRL